MTTGNSESDTRRQPRDTFSGAYKSVPESPRSDNYWLNTFKFHLFDIFLKVGFGYGSLFMLGIELETFGAFGLMVFVLSFLQHANIKINAGFLNWIIATAELHLLAPFKTE